MIQGNGTTNTQNALVLLAVGLAGPPLQLFPDVGRVYVRPMPGLVLPIGQSDANGDLTSQILPAGAIPPNNYPPIFFQAVYAKGSGDVTNADAAEVLR